MKKITALALSAALLLSGVISVMAETDILSESFDNTAEIGAYWTTLTSGSGISLSVDEGFLKAKTSNGNSNRTGAIALDSITNKEYMSLSVDFKAGNYNSTYTLKHGFSVKDSDNKEIFNIIFPNHRGASAEPLLNEKALTGVTLPNKSASEWYTLSMVMDFNTHRMAYAVTKQGAEDIIYEQEVVPMSAEASGIGIIEFYANRGYNTDFVAIDNIVLSEIENPELPAPPIVESISASYQADGNEVKSEVIELENAVEGESVSYISSNYIKGNDGKYYYIASNYNADKSNVILNDTSEPVNSSLKATANSINQETVITYNVTEADGLVFFSELEDILGTNASDAPNGRYMASGGKMTSTSGTKAFYEVTSDGYYQVLLVGCPQGAGTAIFKNADSAGEAQAYDDNSIVGFNSTKNDYYGIYSCATHFLEEGDNLTIRGFGSGGVTDKLDYVSIRKITSGEISGTDGASIIPGGMSVPFEFVSDVDAVPVWSVEGEGLSIDQNGVLTVSENAKEGTAVIKAVVGDNAVTAQKTIEIAEVEISEYKFRGTASLNIGDSEKYYAEAVKDQFGNDITDYVKTSFISSDACVEIDTDGSAKAKNEGSTEIELTISAGNATAKAEKTVVSDWFYIIADAQSDKTTVDVSRLIDNDSIKGYRITTADVQGNKVSEYTVEDIDRTPVKTAEDAVQIIAEYNQDGILESVRTNNIKAGEAAESVAGARSFLWNSLEEMKPVSVTGGITIETKDADRVEISPIYEFTFDENAGEDVVVPCNFADGEYDFTITKSTLRKLDLYVNGYMIGNNINEKGVGRTMTDADRIYSINDILVDEGIVTISKLDCTTPSEAGIDSVVISKAPSVAKRKQKVYIIGDSLVSNYYGELEGMVGTGRSGWGQVFGNFLNDDTEAVNLAMAGQYASGLLITAFPGIMHTAHEGDYLIIESGWNDLKYSSYNEMYESVLKMVDECEEKGIHPVLVTPNASSNTWASKANVRLSSAMRAAAETAQEKYDDVIFVDLAQISYDYLYEMYGNDADVIDANFSLGTAGGDTLHLSYLAAMKWAEVVAQGMADNGVEFINKKFKWSVTDTEGNEIITQIE